MKAYFNAAADTYDTTFTHTVIGKLQRQLVYDAVVTVLKNNAPKSILEINCGTGEDAIWLAEKGYQVTATDLSEKMIAVAKSKSDSTKINFKQADVNALNDLFSNEKFDLLFSNFGGLNCLSKKELQTFFNRIPKLISDKGHLILVIMPKNTLWEQFYFLMKGQFKLIFRRKKESALANVNGEKMKTFYYNPNDIKKMVQDNFEIKQSKPIGFFIPPSYLEPFVKNKPKLISILNTLEQKIKTLTWLSKYADHYVIVLQKK